MILNRWNCGISSNTFEFNSIPHLRVTGLMVRYLKVRSKSDEKGFFCGLQQDLETAHNYLNDLDNWIWM